MDVQKFELCEGPVERLRTCTHRCQGLWQRLMLGAGGDSVQMAPNWDCHKGQQTGTTLYRGDGL